MDIHLSIQRSFAIIYIHLMFYLLKIKKKTETFHPEILKKSNHILRNCKNADIGNSMYGTPDPMVPVLHSPSKETQNGKLCFFLGSV